MEDIISWSPLLICSSKGDDEFEEDGATVIFPGGMALAVVELMDVRKMTKEDLEKAFLPDEWHEDALKGYAWHVRPLYAVIPMPVKGRLNLFNVDLELEKIPAHILNHYEYLRFSQGFDYLTVDDPTTPKRP